MTIKIDLGGLITAFFILVALLAATMKESPAQEPTQNTSKSLMQEKQILTDKETAEIAAIYEQPDFDITQAIVLEPSE